jgi:hypothetical protein
MSLNNMWSKRLLPNTLHYTLTEISIENDILLPHVDCCVSKITSSSFWRYHPG